MTRGRRSSVSVTPAGCEVGEAVEELDAASLPLEADDHLLQGLRNDASGINGYLLHVGLVGRKDGQRADIGGCFGQDDVARIDEELGDDVDGLLRAGGDDDVLGVALMPSRAMTLVICSRNCGMPCPFPYCSARPPSSRIIREVASARRSSGRSLRLGIPPASDTTSGREATANNDRVSEARRPWARAA